MKHGIQSGAISALLLAATVALTGCLGGDDKGSASRTDELGVIDIDYLEQTITTWDGYYDCDGEESKTDTVIWTDQYEITGGKLYRWSPGSSCRASVMAGTSTGIVGTWTGNPPLFGDAPVDDSAYCDMYAYWDREVMTEVGRNLKVVDVISEEKITTTVSGEACWAEMQGWLLTTNAGMEETIERSAKQCGAVTLTRLDSADIDFEEEPFGPTATITSRETATGITMVFTTGDVRCEATLPVEDDVVQDCTEGGAEVRFESCAYLSGFFGEGVFLLKNGASTEKRRTLRSMFRAL